MIIIDRDDLSFKLRKIARDINELAKEADQSQTRFVACDWGDEVVAAILKYFFSPEQPLELWLDKQDGSGKYLVCKVDCMVDGKTYHLGAGLYDVGHKINRIDEDFCISKSAHPVSFIDFVCDLLPDSWFEKNRFVWLSTPALVRKEKN